MQRMHWARAATIVYVFVVAACASAPAARDDLEVSDAWITTRAENEIQTVVEPEDRVMVQTENGVVELSGVVQSVRSAEEIERRVTGIRGVRDVRNRLEVGG